MAEHSVHFQVQAVLGVWPVPLGHFGAFVDAQVVFDGNFMVFQVFPLAADRTYETWDFYFETAELTDAEVDAARYINEVLQPQDIAIVESVQRGMSTPAFTQGRIVVDPNESGLSEHAVHHFHGLVLNSYRNYLSRSSSQES